MMMANVMADEVKFGISRPTFTTEEGVTIYDTFNYIETTDNFANSIDGVAVKFYQSPEIEATIVADPTSESGYESKDLCHQGQKNISVDYCWKVLCNNYDSSTKMHANDGTIGSENFIFGFDFTVAEGRTLKVNALELDLLVEQNPSYCITISDASGNELYNSTWVTKTGGYNNEEWGAGSYCRINTEGVSFLFEKMKDDMPINYQAIEYYPGFDEKYGGMETPLPADFTLAAGTYSVRVNCDYNKDSVKGLSFDNFTIEGELSGGAAGGTVAGISRPTFTTEEGVTIYDTFDYIGTTDNFANSIDGVAVKFYQSPEIEATIVADPTSESGYESKNLCHQGQKNISVDYCWKILCNNYDSSAKMHANDGTIGSENFIFGFDFTVADGKSFTISAIELDLLVEQNPSYCITISDASGNELYNSTWVTKTGGYNNEEWGAGSYCRIDTEGVSFLFEKMKDGMPINYQAIEYYPGFDEKYGGMETPLPANFILGPGTYSARVNCDYNKDSVKGLSFDHFSLEGVVGGAEGITTVATSNMQRNGATYNLLGQRVSNTIKGQIYIKNGVKFIAK